MFFENQSTSYRLSEKRRSVPGIWQLALGQGKTELPRTWPVVQGAWDHLG